MLQQSSAISAELSKGNWETYNVKVKLANTKILTQPWKSILSSKRLKPDLFDLSSDNNICQVTADYV